VRRILGSAWPSSPTGWARWTVYPGRTIGSMTKAWGPSGEISESGGTGYFSSNSEYFVFQSAGREPSRSTGPTGPRRSVGRPPRAGRDGVGPRRERNQCLPGHGTAQPREQEAPSRRAAPDQGSSEVTGQKSPVWGSWSYSTGPGPPPTMAPPPPPPAGRCHRPWWTARRWPGPLQAPGGGRRGAAHPGRPRSHHPAAGEGGEGRGGRRSSRGGPHVFGAEASGHRGVGHAFNGETRHRQVGGRRPEETDPSTDASPRRSRPARR
jgi:hypothetical protein